MILAHIFIIVLILIQKFNVKIIKQSSVGFIRKYLNKYNKVENFINKLGELSNKYLSVLIIIKVIIIIFFVCLKVSSYIELSSNLNEYISVYKFILTKGKFYCCLKEGIFKNKSSQTKSKNNPTKSKSSPTVKQKQKKQNKKKDFKSKKWHWILI